MKIRPTLLSRIITAFKVTTPRLVLLDLPRTILFQWQLKRFEQLKVIVLLLALWFLCTAGGEITGPLSSTSSYHINLWLYFCSGNSQLWPLIFRWHLPHSPQLGDNSLSALSLSESSSSDALAPPPH